MGKPDPKSPEHVSSEVRILAALHQSRKDAAQMQAKVQEASDKRAALLARSMAQVEKRSERIEEVAKEISERRAARAALKAQRLALLGQRKSTRGRDAQQGPKVGPTTRSRSLPTR